ncbi:hypothetical protein TNCV_1864851 [Trichonephila clavipes]|nr:hypothetical protein TNCV_1864851 [Trichonephila clavipes]
MGDQVVQMGHCISKKEGWLFFPYAMASWRILGPLKNQVLGPKPDLTKGYALDVNYALGSLESCPTPRYGGCGGVHYATVLMPRA